MVATNSSRVSISVYTPCQAIDVVVGLVQSHRLSEQSVSTIIISGIGKTYELEDGLGSARLMSPEKTSVGSKGIIVRIQ